MNRDFDRKVVSSFFCSANNLFSYLFASNNFEKDNFNRLTNVAN